MAQLRQETRDGNRDAYNAMVRKPLAWLFRNSVGRFFPAQQPYNGPKGPTA